MEKEKKSELDRVVESLELMLTLLKMKDLVASKGLQNKSKLRMELGEPSLSTLKRHVRRLYELGFEIKMRGKNLQVSSWGDSGKFMNIRNLVSTLHRKLNEEFDRSKFMSFDHDSFDTGQSSKFNSLAKFAKDETVVAFFYSAVGSQPKRVIVLPRHLAERNNRFYCIAYRFDKERDITYSLERIESKEIQPVENQGFYQEAIDKLPKFDKATWFEHIIGISNEEAELMDIKLLYSPKQALYMREYPIHPKEKVIFDDERGRCTEVKLKNTYELRAKILELGAGIEVLEPEKLRVQIKNIIEENLSRY
jgi:predicted DNA-binding transcriptional regulator YafY